MKANVPKPQKPPRPFERLPEYQRQQINKFFTDQMYNGMDKENERVQEVMIKANCIYKHDFEGADEEQLLQYIASWRRFYRTIERFKTEEELNAWLSEQMKRCFPTCGFPQMRIDELKKAEGSILYEQRNTYNAGAETEDL